MIPQRLSPRGTYEVLKATQKSGFTRKESLCKYSKLQVPKFSRRPKVKEIEPKGGDFITSSQSL